ncbi:MAG: hypothetical protein J6F31_00375 [Oscillospiraceae bacterium]|nr:hypothetical protein [Oscillospiraceae bacterium]
MKQGAKIIGFEALYLLLAGAAGFGCTLLQFVGRRFVDSYSSFIFSGNIYTYHPLFYILGIVLYCGGVHLSGKLFFRKLIYDPVTNSGGFKAAYIVTALIFCFLMVIANVFAAFILCGMTVSMRPEELAFLTVLGLPAATFIYMIVILFVPE